MSNKSIFLVLVMVIGVVLTGVIVLAIAVPSVFLGEPAVSRGEAAGPGPVEVTESFYSWYLANLGYGPETGDFRKPSEADYEARPEASPELLARRAEIIASFAEMQGGGYDPLLCAQDVPESFSAELVETGDGEALVKVETSFVGHSFGVRLQAGETWQIVEVQCALP